MSTTSLNSAKEIFLDEVNGLSAECASGNCSQIGLAEYRRFIEKYQRTHWPAVPRPPNAPENNTPFIIGKSKVIDGTFSYDDPRQSRDKEARVFDYSHFSLKHLYGELKNFLVQGDTISFLPKT
jgi:hypothetical protein